MGSHTECGRIRNPGCPLLTQQATWHWAVSRARRSFFYFSQKHYKCSQQLRSDPSSLRAFPIPPLELPWLSEDTIYKGEKWHARCLILSNMIRLPDAEALCCESTLCKDREMQGDGPLKKGNWHELWGTMQESKQLGSSPASWASVLGGFRMDTGPWDQKSPGKANAHDWNNGRGDPAGVSNTAQSEFSFQKSLSVLVWFSIISIISIFIQSLKKWRKTQKSLSNPMLRRFSHIFSSKSVIVLGSIFRSLMYFELIFVYDVS